MSLQLNIHGGRSLQNRSKRFEEVVSEVPGPGAYNVHPASGNTLRAVTVAAGQAEKLGRKTVGIWVKLQVLRTSKWAVKQKIVLWYIFSFQPVMLCKTTVRHLYIWRMYEVTALFNLLKIHNGSKSNLIPIRKDWFWYRVKVCILFTFGLLVWLSLLLTVKCFCPYLTRVVSRVLYYTYCTHRVNLYFHTWNKNTIHVNLSSALCTMMYCICGICQTKYSSTSSKNGDCQYLQTVPCQ